MQVIDYTLLTSKSTHTLSLGVRDLLREGWQPQGGVAINDSTGETVVAQAMVKYAQSKSE